MKKIHKTIRRIGIFLGLIIALLPFPVFAQENSGTIHIEQKDTETKRAVKGISLTLYQIADTDGNGSYSLQPEFQNSGVEAEKLGEKESYNQNVQLLDSFIEKNNISGVSTKVTDANGVVDYTGLSDGVYFVKQTNTQEDFERLGYSYQTDSYLIVLPWTNENGYLTRVVNCKPKGKLTYPEKTGDLIVHKVWKDNNDKAGKRPQQISVGLYCNGTLQEKVTLNAANNWTYQWEGLSKKDEWKIEELNVPKGYASSVTSEENIYTVTNKWTPAKPPAKVKTGDQSPVILYVSICIAAIVVLIVILIYRKKHND